MARVWDGDELPLTSLETMRTYLSRTRGRLRVVGEQAQVERPSRGLYRLSVDPEHVDLLRFQRLRKDAGSAAERARRIEQSGC